MTFHDCNVSEIEKIMETENRPLSPLSFLRTFVFELGAVLLLPLLLGVDGIWYSGVLAELMAAVTGSIFMVALRRKYQY